MNADWRW